MMTSLFMLRYNMGYKGTTFFWIINKISPKINFLS